MGIGADPACGDILMSGLTGTNPVEVNWKPDFAVVLVSAGDRLKDQYYNPSTEKFESCVPLRELDAAARTLVADWGPCGDDGLERSGS